MRCSATVTWLGAAWPTADRPRTDDGVDRRLDTPRRRPSRQADTVRITGGTILMRAFRPASSLRSRTGLVIPAHPLALTEDGRSTSRRQRALIRYYLAAGAAAWRSASTRPSSRSATRSTACSSRCWRWRPRRWIGRIVARPAAGPDRRRLRRARPGRRRGGAGSATSATTPACSAWPRWPTPDDAAPRRPLPRPSPSVIPLVGFYLQPTVGGRVLPLRLLAASSPRSRTWSPSRSRPFNRYQTLDVVRAVVEAGPRRHRPLHRQRRQHRASTW